ARIVRPRSTPDTLASFPIDMAAGDAETSVAQAVVRYSTDGWRTSVEIPLTPHGVAPTVEAVIPRQPRGARVSWYARATDAAGNTARVPGGESTFAFAVLPASPAVVLRAADAPAALAPDALEAELGASADLWDVA